MPDNQMMASERFGRNRVTQSINIPSASTKRKPFVPLSDLLHRKHDDRVSEYLEKMKGLSIDEIVNTSILNKASTAHETGTPDKQDRRDNLTLNTTLSPLARGNQNPSKMSMGMTPKQVSIVDTTRNKSHNLAMAPPINTKRAISKLI